MRPKIALIAVLALVAMTVPGSVTASTMPEDPPEFELMWGGFNRPSGMAISDADEVYVSGHFGHRVQVFNLNGVYLRHWTTPGEPGDMDFDAAGYVYLVMHNRHRIQVHQDDGALERMFGSWGGAEGQLYYPSGIALDENDNVFVADRNNHRIQVFDREGVFRTMWGWGVDSGAPQFEICTSGCQPGIYGSGDGQFWGPSTLALGPDGNLYVADAGNSRVQVFDTGGRFLRKWGTYGTGEGQFITTSGVTVADDGSVYVADPRSHRIQKFTAVGTFLSMWGSLGSGEGQFYAPVDVELGPNNEVFVTEHFNHRVQKFVYPNQLPDCSAAYPSLETLWPPNHEFVPVEVLGVTDPDGDPITITIDSIFQDEPVDSTGDGAFAPDGIGVGTAAADVRAERDGAEDGRVYHIGFTADDGRGGTCTSEVLVGVPVSQRKGVAVIDDGALYDSTIAP